MKKLISLVAFCFATLVMSAQLPTALGDFVLGNSIGSVEEILHAKGLKKVDVGFLQESTYVNYPQVEMPEGGDMIQASFPIANPYMYAGEKWQYINLFFYQGKLFKIEFEKGYWAEGFEDDVAVKDCQKSLKALEQKANSKYAKYRKEGIDGRNANGEGRFVSNYSDDKNSISIEYWFFEYEGVSLSYKLFDSAINKKVFPSDYE